MKIFRAAFVSTGLVLLLGSLSNFANRHIPVPLLFVGLIVGIGLFMSGFYARKEDFWPARPVKDKEPVSDCVARFLDNAGSKG